MRLYAPIAPYPQVGYSRQGDIGILTFRFYNGALSTRHCRRRIITAANQVVVSAYAGNAGAGGAMLGLGADVVVARAGLVLNPYYEMGLYGSELHTYTLPARVGTETATRLTTERLPVDAARAVDRADRRGGPAGVGGVRRMAARGGGRAG